MRIHHLQHVPFEGLGSMEPYFLRKGYPLTATHLYRGEPLPGLDALDWLIVMGGPMGVGDAEQYPWMRAEKAFIRAAMDSGKTVLGICLGAQLMADALGAEVGKNEHREIGWFPIHASKHLDGSLLQDVFPPRLEVFHWHGDTFDLPVGSLPIASSEATPNQGFILGDRIIGLQFHLETTPDSARALIENCRGELEPLPYVQGEAAMLADESRFTRINQVMRNVLERLSGEHT